MREFLELRVLEEVAATLFAPREGVRLGTSVRKVTLGVGDPRLDELAMLQRSLSARGAFAFAGWRYIRKYSPTELASAELLHVNFTSTFEPAGEECGTIYDESTACPICGAGRSQTSPLRLDLRRAPKHRDLARTIADEWIVSQRLAEILARAQLRGYALRPVQHKAFLDDTPVDLSRVEAGRALLQRAALLGIDRGSWEFMVWLDASEQAEALDQVESQTLRAARARARRRAPPPNWYQLVVTSAPVPMTEPTKFGIGPFDEDAPKRYVCPLGHTAGLNLLSEVWLDRARCADADLLTTTQCVGVRRGVLVPAPELLMSPRLHALLTEHGVSGFKVEIARFAGQA